MKIKINNQDTQDYKKVQNTQTSRSDLSLPTHPLSTENTPESSSRCLKDDEPPDLRDLIDPTHTGWEHTESNVKNQLNPNLHASKIQKGDMSIKEISRECTPSLHKMVDHSKLELFNKTL